MLLASEHQWKFYHRANPYLSSYILHNYTQTNQNIHWVSKGKNLHLKNRFMYSYSNRGVKTSQALARTEKKQNANKSNFAQSTDAPKDNMKPEPDQSISPQKICSIIMLFYLHNNSNTVSNGKYFLQKILGNLWMYFLYSCKGLIVQDAGWSQAWLFKRQLDELVLLYKWHFLTDQNITCLIWFCIILMKYSWIALWLEFW